MSAFEKFINPDNKRVTAWEAVEVLAEIRLFFAFSHALKGFGVTYDKAIEIIKDNSKTDSVRLQNKRTVLRAALDNLTEFAVAAEYQFIDEVQGYAQEELDIDEDWLEEDLDIDLDELSDEDKQEIFAILKRYNYQYATVENGDIAHSMIVAATLLGYGADDTLTYTTQGDERVRPWHAQYEGFTAPKRLFPQWLVPPIEHACRCYLVDGGNGKLSDVSSMADVKAQVEIPSPPADFDLTFKESVAFGGRIFSDAHSYFQMEESHRNKVNEIANKLKRKMLQ